MNLRPLFEPFQGEEHRPFQWQGGAPAALLVHGFPGTPAEMRPLGQALHRAGWTVHGPLLPGFGPEIETIFDKKQTEWVLAVEQALKVLQRSHKPVLLIGFSMGAALSLQVAAQTPPDGLVLIAPFLQLGTRWQRWIGMLLKPFLHNIRPLRWLDLADPQLRHGISRFFPKADLDDPEVQAALRDLQIPLTIFEQLHRAGQTAYRLAPHVAVPTLIIQGTEDEIVPLDRTRHLLQRLPGPLHYIELVTTHELTLAQDPAWPEVERAVLNFVMSA